MLQKSLAALMCASLLLSASCASSNPNSKADSNGGLTAANAKAKADGTPVADSDIVPVDDSPVRGPNAAPVTIVEFADFQCPFCGRASATIDQLMSEKKYQGKIRLVFKHFPLPFHQQAQAASRAALAAGEQGKFWPMYDMLYDNQQAFGGDFDQMKDLTAGYAQKLGLNVEQFRKDMEKPGYNDVMRRDVELGQKLGVRGTPDFFINGEEVTGAQPLPVFEQAVDQQLNEAAAAKKKGVPADKLYKTLVAQNYKPPAPVGPEAKPQPPARDVTMVPIAKDDPVRGSKKAVVTIVEFADFQCPFCARAAKSLDKLRSTYGDKIRLVYKFYPLPFHPYAEPAAKLALAAHQHGKFWQTYDLLYNNQHRLDEKDIFVKFGQKVGLSKKQVDAAMTDQGIAKHITRDENLAEKLDVRGTPTFFINGVRMVGAQPYPRFAKLVDEQLEVAKKVRAEHKNLSGDALYKAEVAYNDAHNQEAAGDQPEPDAQPAPHVDTSKLTVDPDQVKGPKNARVTIFIFSDFQCPYCRLGSQHLEDALAKVDGSVKVIYKHFPLPMHPNARPAAMASMAAGAQGKFWPMHDLLFANQKRLGEKGIYVELAKKLGLNIDKFKKDMSNPAFKKQIETDMQEGQELGVDGTPAFFIDGTRVVGAQPTSEFVTKIRRRAEREAVNHLDS